MVLELAESSGDGLERIAAEVGDEDNGQEGQVHAVLVGPERIPNVIEMDKLAMQARTRKGGREAVD